MIYKFEVILCGGYTSGEIEILAKDEDEAYNKALEIVGKRLYKAFPELGIDYNVEMVFDEANE